MSELVVIDLTLDASRLERLDVPRGESAGSRVSSHIHLTVHALAPR